MDAKTWNKQHPVGTPVTAYPGARTGDGLRTHTRAPASTLGSGQAVVSVAGYAGDIALDHVDVREPDAERKDMEIPMALALVMGGQSREDAGALIASYRAAVLREEADEVVASCPDHGPRDETWMDCRCDAADELRRRADEIGGEGR
ncbi:hypothetical protein ACXZ65_34440 [Streptomyces aculeolatus]